LVAIYDNDRLGRDAEVKVAKDFRYQMRLCGVQVYSVNQPIILRDPEEYKDDPYYDEGVILQESLHDWQSSSTVLKFRRRSIEGKLERVRGGRMINTPPYGYRLEPARDNKGELILDKRGKVIMKRVVSEKEMEVVRRIYAHYVYDGKSMNEIRDTLNFEGIKPQKAYAWERASISRILKNPTYCGYLVYNKVKRRKRPDGSIDWGKNKKSDWVVVQPKETEHEAIINEELFDAAQRVREAKVSQGSSAVNSQYLWSGFLKCGVCGSTMYHIKSPSRSLDKETGKMVKINDYHGYVCGRWSRFKDTDKNYVNVKDVEDAVFGDIKRLADDEEVLKSFLGQRERQKMVDKQELLERKRKVLNGIKSRDRRQFRAYEVGAISLEKYQEYQEELRGEAERLAADVKELERAVSEGIEKQSLKELFVRTVSNFEDVLKSRDIRKQKQFLWAIIRDVIIKNGEIKIDYRID